ncbi:MAG: hypothetical protein EBS05_23735 [Proteobacteria bacterium]|jgi:hypothetical protein|nr:hypothetical protein [Pseudomonadota bacterium]
MTQTPETPSRYRPLVETLHVGDLVAVHVPHGHPTWTLATVHRLERTTHADDRTGQPTEAVVLTQPFIADVAYTAPSGTSERCWVSASDLCVLGHPTDEELDAQWAWAGIAW